MQLQRSTDGGKLAHSSQDAAREAKCEKRTCNKRTRVVKGVCGVEEGGLTECHRGGQSRAHGGTAVTRRCCRHAGTSAAARTGVNTQFLWKGGRAHE